MSDLLKYRDKFSSVKNCHYLISNSLGAMPDNAVESMNRFTDIWHKRGVRVWEEEWWMLPQKIGNKIGSLMNVANDTVSMHANVTSAQAVILSCFDYSQKRNKIVMVDTEFPSLLYLYKSWPGASDNLKIVECPGGITVPTEKVLDEIDETTLLVPISLVMFRSSYIVDVKAIIEKAHSVGALVLLDIFQALGTIPVDIAELDADFAVGGCLKWLCGGPSAAFLYVRPELNQKLKPKFTGWIAHENPFAFDRHEMRYTTGSYRFLNGTPIIPSLYSCEAGLDIITEIGADAIRKRSMEMTALILKLAGERNWPTFTPKNPNERAGTVALTIPNAESICTELNARDFLVDYRPEAGLRVSPHFYNTDQEIDDLFTEIDKIQQT